MIGMIETGIPKLDQLLKGSIKKGSNILLIGPPMSGKKIILNHIMYYNVLMNDNAVITVNTCEPGTRILEWFEENKLPLPESRIGIVDCITKMTSYEAANDNDVIKMANHWI